MNAGIDDLRDGRSNALPNVNVKCEGVIPAPTTLALGSQAHTEVGLAQQKQIQAIEKRLWKAVETLLPKLLSGEIELLEAEAIAEETCL